MSNSFKPNYELYPAWIVCAAIMHPSSERIITGVRHYCPLMRQQIIESEGITFWREKTLQGFVDQYGKFYNREDAWIIAERNGQIKKQVSSPGTLYSENLY